MFLKVVSKPAGLYPMTVTDLAEALHEDWRLPRYQPEHGRFEPRIRGTSDKGWIARNQNNSTLDIANTPFHSLPKDWKEENAATAEVVQELLQGVSQFDDAFIRQTAATVHDKWLERRAQEKIQDEGPKAAKEKPYPDRVYADKAHLPFEELSLDLQAKDIAPVMRGIELATKGCILINIPK